MMLHEYTLDNGTSYKIAPEMGCNIFSWVTKGREVFYRDNEFMHDPNKFVYGGNPVLFPAVGRTWDRSLGAPRFGIYKIHGFDREFFMPLHGLMQSAVCQCTTERVSSKSIRVEYDVTLPECTRAESYPFDVSLKLTYLLEESTICMEAVVVNHSDVAAPYAFGYHPWLATTDPSRAGVEVRIPCAWMATLVPNLAIPDGGRRAVDGVFHFQPGTAYDGVYSGLNGRRSAMIDVPAGRTVYIDIDENIADIVIASPAGTPAVCVEPWTAGIGCFEELALPDWQTSTRLPLIKPKSTKSIKIRYTVEDKTDKR